MDILNQAFQQIKEVYDELTPGSRVLAILLATVLVVSLGYMFVQSVPSTQEEYLFDRQVFDSGTLRNMATAFADAGLNDYDITAGRVKVAAGKRDEYTAALSEAKALPANFGDIMRDAAERDSAWATKGQREQAIKEALQRELSNIFSQMPDIETAAVNYDITTESGFQQKPVYSAAVSVKPNSSASLDKALIPGIVYTVIGAVGGQMQPSDVKVVDLNSGMAYQGSEDGLVNSGGTSLPAREANQQERYQRTIEEFLRTIPGVVVGVSVKLDEFISMSEREIEHASKTTTVSMVENTTSREHEGAEEMARPGYEAQGNQPRPLLGASETLRGDMEKEETSDLSTRSAVPGVERVTSFAPLPVTKVTASIQIPHGYILNLWHLANPSAEGEELLPPAKDRLEEFRLNLFRDISKQIGNMLPDVTGADSIVGKETLVNVSEYHIPTPPQIAGTPLTATVTQWWMTNWTTLGMFGLVGVSMLMLWSMLKDKTPEPEPVIEEIIEEEEEEMPEPEPTPEPQLTAAQRERERQLQNFDDRQMSLKEELSTLVEESPDAAANVLRQWIGNVSSNA